RERLGVRDAPFPLARMLEGGTWAAGRRTADERRPGGGPPFTIISDGTVF
ncbi:MAG: URC4/urg3 family protein, partial [Pseudomonadota bacterium]|nr:URC4/urg3 family protein [Pseudomonadota bacterium]